MVQWYYLIGVNQLVNHLNQFDLQQKTHDLGGIRNMMTTNMTKNDKRNGENAILEEDHEKWQVLLMMYPVRVLENVRVLEKPHFSSLDMVCPKKSRKRSGSLTISTVTYHSHRQINHLELKLIHQLLLTNQPSKIWHFSSHQFTYDNSSNQPILIDTIPLGDNKGYLVPPSLLPRSSSPPPSAAQRSSSPECAATRCSAPRNRRAPATSNQQLPEGPMESATFLYFLLDLQQPPLALLTSW